MKTSLLFACFLACLFSLGFCANRPNTRAIHAAARQTGTSCARVNVCFALHEGFGLSNGAKKNQAAVVRSAVFGISRRDRTFGMAATVYSNVSNPLTTFTRKRSDLITPLRTGFVTIPSREPNVNAGLNFCFRQLFRQTDRINRIVVLGNGLFSPSDPEIDRRSGRFFRQGGQVYVVGIGSRRNQTRLLEIAGGNRDNVFNLNSPSRPGPTLTGRGVGFGFANIFCNETETAG